MKQQSADSQKILWSAQNQLTSFLSKPKYGQIVSGEINKQFGICDNQFFAPVLISASCAVEYVDEKMVDLLCSYARQSNSFPEDSEEEDQNEEEKPNGKKGKLQQTLSLSSFLLLPLFAQVIHLPTKLMKQQSCFSCQQSSKLERLHTAFNSLITLKKKQED